MKTWQMMGISLIFSLMYGCASVKIYNGNGQLMSKCVSHRFLSFGAACIGNVGDK